MRLNVSAGRVGCLKCNDCRGPIGSSELADDVHDENILEPLRYLEMSYAFRSNDSAANVQLLVGAFQPDVQVCVFDRRPFAHLLKRKQQGR